MVAGRSTEPDAAGARLASARARLGLSLEQVAERLRLDRQTIAALEAGDHQLIGAAVFVRGFLRRYATLVGESPAEIEALFAQRPDAEAMPDLSRTGMHPIDPCSYHRKLGVVPALVGATVLGIVGVIWWAMRAKPVAPVSAERALAVTGDAGAGGTAGAGSAATTPAAAAAAAAGADAGAAATATDEAPPVLPARRGVQLTFSGECWVEVYDARGVRLFFGFGHADTTEELSGVPPFRLVLGNVEAVALAVGGVAVALPGAAAGERVRLMLRGNGEVISAR